jgi:hypothetical protein
MLIDTYATLFDAVPAAARDPGHTITVAQARASRPAARDRAK